MPIYEYLCQACNVRFELKQSIKAPPLATCERCGKEVNRVISAPAIMFKGSGWYVTDYSDKMKAPASADGADKPANGQSKDQQPASPAPTKSESAPPAASSSPPATSSSPTKAGGASGSTSSTSSAGSGGTSAGGHS